MTESGCETNARKSDFVAGSAHRLTSEESVGFAVTLLFNELSRTVIKECHYDYFQPGMTLIRERKRPKVLASDSNYTQETSSNDLVPLINSEPANLHLLLALESITVRGSTSF